MQVSYQQNKKGVIVYRGATKTGIIKKVSGGFAFVPTGQKERGQQVYSSLDACKAAQDVTADEKREPDAAAERETKAEKPLLTFG